MDFSKKYYLMLIEKSLASIAKSQKLIAGGPRPSNPIGPLKFLTTHMAKVYKCRLPQAPEGNPESADIVKGKLTITVEGEVTQVIETTPGQTFVHGLSFPEEKTIGGSFVFVDNVGLESEVPVLAESFVNPDITPPPNPDGILGFSEDDGLDS